jgi:hypothetical protein
MTRLAENSIDAPEALILRVERHMRTKYRVSLAELEISDVPGCWRDKRPKQHPGHPLHSCLGCDGPFRATYTFFDQPRLPNGQFASRTRTWAVLRTHTDQTEDN